MKKILGTLFVSTLLISKCFGHSDLVDIYKLAEKNDVIIKEQLELFNASKKSKFIEGGDLLPQVNLSARRGFTNIRQVNTDVKFYTKGYDLILQQTVFNWAEWQQYLRTCPAITVSEKNWYLANQNLILRVSEAYLNILNATDTLEFAEKEYDAINQLYQESKERYNVGAITRADIDQVKADLDSVTADLYQARASVENNKDRLSEIINTRVPNLAKIKNNPKFPYPNPKSVKKWLDIAKKYNLNLQAAHANRLVAEHDIKIAESNFLPTALLTARLRGSDNRRILDNLQSGGIQRPFVNSVRVDLTVSSPNLNPYGSISEHKKSKMEYHRTDKEFLEQYRATEREIKQSYRDAISFSRQVTAFKQAVKAAQSSLDATKENFEVGTRTYVIVLERISDLYSAKRDYRNAIYQYILSLLRLENAAGRLSIKDLVSVNKLLYKHKPVTKSKNKVKA